jgi:hypothetical protein
LAQSQLKPSDFWWVVIKDLKIEQSMHFAISFHLKKETHQSKFKIKTGPLFQSREGGGGGNVEL